MPTLYCAVTAHGFGHATRIASVLAVLQAQAPEIKLIIATNAPQWLLAQHVKEFVYHQRSFDVGVVQADALQMDKYATLKKWQNLQQQAPSLISQEAQFLQAEKVDLVLADIPHLAVDIAHTAGVPCWMMSNFGWDFIYRNWGAPFIELADWLSSSYHKCDRLFRLPFYEAMSSFPVIEDVGLTGTKPHFDPVTLYTKLGLDPHKRTVLLTFGGLSLQAIPYGNVARFPDTQFITFDQDAPDLPNLKKVDRHTQIRPVDVMQVCDLVITKPGYGTLSEIYRSHKPVVCLTRTDFAESDLLITGVRDYMHHIIIDPPEFYETSWEFLNWSIQPPATDLKLAEDGEVKIAEGILDYLC